MYFYIQSSVFWPYIFKLDKKFVQSVTKFGSGSTLLIFIKEFQFFCDCSFGCVIFFKLKNEIMKYCSISLKQKWNRYIRTKWYWTGFFLYPPAKTTSGWKKLAHITVGMVVVGTNLLGLAASETYFLRYLPIDLTQSLFALFHIVVAISMLFLRHKMPPIFDNLSKIFHTSKDLIVNVCMFQI